jgi:hypothetical protein
MNDRVLYTGQDVGLLKNGQIAMRVEWPDPGHCTLEWTDESGQVQRQEVNPIDCMQPPDETP